MRFFDKAMQANDVPNKVTMDKSGANKAAIDEIKVSSGIPIIVRQVKYLNNIVEQDHRAVKRITKPALNFRSFQSAKCVLAGIELMHMVRKGQLIGLQRDVFCRPILWAGRANPSSLKDWHSPPPESRPSAANATKPSFCRSTSIPHGKLALWEMPFRPTSYLRI